MKVPEKIEIKTYHVKKGENIVHLLIKYAEEFVSIKNKINEIIEYLDKKDKGGE